MGGETITDATGTISLNERADERETRRWQAVLARDRSADGAFVYAVVTTGVFCRPGCSSRTPRRDNVVFLNSATVAIGAGYRPCKRCRPESTASPYASDVAMIEKVCHQIAQAEEVPLVRDLAQTAGLSVYHFHRVFKSVTGITPKQYIMAHRQQRFRDGLRQGKTVTEAIYGSGFGASSRAYAGSDGALGMPPGAYRRGAEGIEIWWATAPCELGWILVAATVRGICCIAFADTPELLRAELNERFPKARMSRAGPEFMAWVDAVLAAIETPERGLKLPLDIQGTVFQHRVWQALRQVPAGKTISYAELARRVGVPKGARAAGRACAANSIAMAIPCHRAVRGDGALASYRWGINRKEALLKRETKPDGTSQRE